MRSPDGSAIIARRGTTTSRDSHADTIAIAVRATDQITAQGAAAHLATYPELTLLAPHEYQRCEVLLVLAAEVTDATIDLIREASQGYAAGPPAMVLVADAIDDEHLLHAVEYGLVGLLRRGQTDFDQVAETIRAARSGYANLPIAVLRALTCQVRGSRAAQRRSEGPSLRDLTMREADVLRLLSEGLDTSEVATSLNYSERTVKNVIHQALTRLKLRNRVHAVAYALRTGAID